MGQTIKKLASIDFLDCGCRMEVNGLEERKEGAKTRTALKCTVKHCKQHTPKTRADRALYGKEHYELFRRFSAIASMASEAASRAAYQIGLECGELRPPSSILTPDTPGFSLPKTGVDPKEILKVG